ncbi:hypothetical protein QBC47DRAFT_435565 [Echria macrotheca]|uniref:Uncharacterized protein n=1 Tax=Echria macrotheca TaxID=438768 RepID=A0AAJ0B692_9PEZI|nr:hypothetical protein QBC47DRAFT_435565 [Echria macrotheca]
MNPITQPRATGASPTQIIEESQKWLYSSYTLIQSVLDQSPSHSTMYWKRVSDTVTSTIIEMADQTHSLNSLLFIVYRAIWRMAYYDGTPFNREHERPPQHSGNPSCVLDLSFFLRIAGSGNSLDGLKSYVEDITAAEYPPLPPAPPVDMRPAPGHISGPLTSSKPTWLPPRPASPAKGMREALTRRFAIACPQLPVVTNRGVQYHLPPFSVPSPAEMHRSIDLWKDKRRLSHWLMHMRVRYDKNSCAIYLEPSGKTVTTEADLEEQPWVVANLWVAYWRLLRWSQFVHKNRQVVPLLDFFKSHGFSWVAERDDINAMKSMIREFLRDPAGYHKATVASERAAEATRWRQNLGTSIESPSADTSNPPNPEE